MLATCWLVSLWVQPGSTPGQVRASRGRDSGKKDQVNATPEEASLAAIGDSDLFSPIILLIRRGCRPVCTVWQSSRIECLLFSMESKAPLPRIGIWGGFVVSTVHRQASQFSGLGAFGNWKLASVFSSLLFGRSSFLCPAFIPFLLHISFYRRFTSRQRWPNSASCKSYSYGVIVRGKWQQHTSSTQHQ